MIKEARASFAVRKPLAVWLQKPRDQIGQAKNMSDLFVMEGLLF